MRGYQCIRTDRGGERKKGVVLTLVKSHINAYLIPSDSSADSAEYQTIKIKNRNKRDLFGELLLPKQCNFRPT